MTPPSATPVARIADQWFPFAADGHALRMPMFATGDLLAQHPAVTRVVIVINGTLRNAEVYFDSAVVAARAAGAAANHVFIVTPQFLAVPDAQALRPDADVPHWTLE